MTSRSCLARRWPAPFLAGLALAGCAEKGPRPVPQVVVEQPKKSDEWRSIATGVDENRIQTIASAWTAALRDTRKAHAGDVRGEGDLLDPDAALPRPALTPGSYYCRLVKLGRVKPRGPALEKFKPFFCYVDVEGDLLTLVKQTGSERPVGRLWDDDISNRLIFLGSLTRDTDKKPLAYGDDPKRDLAGVVERIGLFRWRLVIPWPQSNSKVEVYELTPVEKQVR